MTLPSRRDEPAPRRAVGPVDEDRMRAAAEDLRDRTMSLEPSAGAVPWLFATLVAALVAGLVALMLIYRLPLQLWIRSFGS